MSMTLIAQQIKFLMPFQVKLVFELDKEVYCQFCTKSSKEEFYLKKCGPFYGPFKDGDKQKFVHENCALWAPNVFLDPAGKLKTVTKEIRRAMTIECSYCGEMGAPTCCIGNGCQKQYHYLCAVNGGCYLDWQKYLLYCPSHLQDLSKKYDLTYEEIINQVDNDRKSNDSREAICCVCFSGLDEDKLVLCDSCAQAYHAYCHDPVVIEAIGDEKRKWYCKNCESNNMEIS